MPSVFVVGLALLELRQDLLSFLGLKKAAEPHLPSSLGHLRPSGEGGVTLKARDPQRLGPCPALLHACPARDLYSLFDIALQIPHPAGLIWA